MKLLDKTKKVFDLALALGADVLFSRTLKSSPDGRQVIGDEVATPFAQPVMPTDGEELAEGQPTGLAGALAQAVAQAKGARLVPIISAREMVYAILAIPEAAADELADSVALQIEALLPLDEEECASSFEVIGLLDGQLIVFAAVVPLHNLEPWQTAIESAGSCVIGRMGATILCWYRGILEATADLKHGRHLVVVRSLAETLLLVIDGGVLIGARGLSAGDTPAAFNRELMVVMANVEMAFGAKAMADTYLFEAQPDPAIAQSLELLVGQPVVSDTLLGLELCTQGLALRITEHPALDLTPKAWRDAERARRAKRIMIATGASLAVAWLGCAATLVFLPWYYQHKTQQTYAAIKAHAPAYERVMSLRERIDLVDRYNVRTHSVLEMLRLVAMVKPQEMIFASFNFRQHQNLRISGTTALPADVYTFKDALEKDERITAVRITRLAMDGKTRRQRFDVDITFDAINQEVSQ